MIYQNAASTDHLAAWVIRYIPFQPRRQKNPLNDPEVDL